MVRLLLILLLLLCMYSACATFRKKLEWITRDHRNSQGLNSSRGCNHTGRKCPLHYAAQIMSLAISFQMIGDRRWNYLHKKKHKLWQRNLLKLERNMSEKWIINTRPRSSFDILQRLRGLTFRNASSCLTRKINDDSWWPSTVMCILEDCAIMHSVQNTTIAPPWQFGL